MSNKKRTKDRLSFKEVLGRIGFVIKDTAILIKEWMIDYVRIILPVVLFICVAVTLFVSIRARARVEAARAEAEAALLESKTEVIELKETEFEEDAYPEINELIVAYYDAIKYVDIEALEIIQGGVTETEELRLQAMSPYIDRYDNIHVFTKPGPFPDTYIVYATVDVFLKEAEPSTPGLQAFYVCMNDDGFYYINTGELSEEEALYIESVSNQADVLDLKNTVNVQYTELMENDDELSAYWAQISVEIDSNVGEKLTEEAVAMARVEEERRAREEEERKNDPSYQEEEEPKIIKVKVNTLVNVRKSASATADKLGTAQVGTIFEMLEIMNNGWTKIDYEGQEAFIKSEFLDEMQDLGSVKVIGRIKATDALNVRMEPDQSSGKLGTLSPGEVVELVEEVGDWSKIKFNDQLGYVKTEYTEKE